MINYQEKLLNQINSFTELPHSILLKGEIGSGHEDVCKYIADKFCLQLYDITDFISIDYINEINQSLTKSLYYINLNKITDREQNIILKLFEEPSIYTYIVLNCEHDDGVLETIKNRSYILNFEKLTKSQLSDFIDLGADKDEENLILSICTTPGQIEIANNTNMKDLYNLCNTLINYISSNNIHDVLGISNKINFKDEYSKFDCMLFYKMLRYILLANGNREIYKIILPYSKFISNMNSKQQYFERMLLELYLKLKS